MTDWYLKIADKEVGPLSSQQLKTMAKKGQFGPEDLIRQGSSGPWVAAGRVKGLLSLTGSEASDSAIVMLPTAKPLEGPVEGPKGQRPAGDRSTARPAMGKTAVTPRKAKPLEPPPSANVIPTAIPMAPEGSSIASQVFADVPPPPVILNNQSAVAPAPAVIGPPRDPLDPAAIKRKMQHQQKRLLAGLVVALVVLACIAPIVISSSGGKPAKSPTSRKSSDSLASTSASQEEAAVQSESDLLESVSASMTGATGGKRGKGDDTWTDAQHGMVTRGPVRVRITAVELGVVRFTRSSERCLMVKFELSNTHDSKIRQYSSWSRLPAGALVDDIENAYQLRSAKLKKESIYPGKSIEEMLLFQRPVSKAKTLRLQLPATAFAEDGMIRFQIPVGMIKEVEEIAMSSEGEALRTRPGQPEGPTPPEREEPQIRRGIEEVEKPQASQPAKAKGATKKTSAASGDSIDKINKDIEAIDGRRSGKEPIITDFEDDPKMQERIEKMKRQAEPKKTSRRSPGG
ncbi:MAG: GYF domain-containing protein [Thermoguttaceae bacterium]